MSQPRSTSLPKVTKVCPAFESLEPRQLLSAVVWSGAVDSVWSDPVNWVGGLAPGSNDTAVFDSTSGQSQVLLTQNADVSEIRFDAGAVGHTLFSNGSDRITSSNVNVAGGVTQDQDVLVTLKHYGNLNFSNLGSGELKFGSLLNTSGDKTTVYTHQIDAVGDVVIGGNVKTSGRTSEVIKTGAGTLSYQGEFDFKLGYNGSSLEQSKFTVNAGTLDISQMTLVFEAHNGSAAVDPATLIEDSYVLIDYAAGSLVTAGVASPFGSVVGLPAGYEVVHDSANQRVLLQVESGTPPYWWEGDTDNDWYNDANWGQDTRPTSADPAYFGATSGSTDISLTSNVYADSIHFVAGANAYRFSNNRFNVGQFTTEAGVTTTQEIDSTIKTSGGLLIDHQGSGDLLLGAYSNTSGDQSTVYTHNIDAGGDITFEGNVKTSGRTFEVLKTGSGKLTYQGEFDFNLGYNGTSLEQSKFVVTEGLLDLSQATLNFESNTGSDAVDAAALTETSYVLVDYSGGAIVTGGAGPFGSVVGLPAGFEIVHDTTSQRVVLQAITGPTETYGTWVGGVSSDWQTDANWANGYRPGPTDTARFDTSSQDLSISLSANANVDKLVFANGAASHTIANQRIEVSYVEIEAGVTTAQQVSSTLKTSGDLSVLNYGGGGLALGGHVNTGGDTTNIYTHAIHTDSNVTWAGNVTTGGRTFEVLKTGIGTLAYQSNFEFNLGHNNNGSVEQSRFMVNAGTLDISQTQLIFQTHTGSSDFIAGSLAQQSYVLIDYSGGQLITAGPGDQVFAGVSNLPAGYDIVHDTVLKQVRIERDAPTGGTLFVEAGGSGDGSSASSPLGVATMSELEAAWNAMAPGETLYLINSPELQDPAGGFFGQTLNLNTGGDVMNGQVRYKSLIGLADGNGQLPTLVGNWSKTDPEAYGADGLTINQDGVAHVRVENLHIEAFESGVYLDNSNQTFVGEAEWDLHFENIHIREVREGFTVDGGAQGLDGEGSSNLSITDSTVEFYTKRGVRLRDGISNVLIQNVQINAGGAAWSVESFPIGFEIGHVDSNDAPNRFITYQDTVSQNHYYDNGSSYWNGDGYSAERGNEYITYLNAEAYNNADGGFDVKSDHVTFNNTVSIGNYRNYRIWGTQGVMMDNILSAWSFGWKAEYGDNQGAIDPNTGNPTGDGIPDGEGRGVGIGIWLDDHAFVTIRNATIHNVDIGLQIENNGTAANQVTLIDSVFSNQALTGYDWDDGEYIKANANGGPSRIKFEGTNAFIGKTTSTPSGGFDLGQPNYLDANDVFDADNDGQNFDHQPQIGIYWLAVNDAFESQSLAYDGLGFDYTLF